jgi:drug/metabolite transporter (DMT)-like permease
MHFVAWAWARGVRPQRNHWMAGVVLGTLYFLLSHGLLYWAEQKVPSGLVALLVATEPMFILLLSWLLAQQKIDRLSILGLSLGMLGVGLLTGADPAINRSSLLRLMAALLASVSWAAGVVVSPRLRLPEDAVMRTAIPLVCAAVMLLATAGVASEFQRMQWSYVSLRSLLGLGISDYLWLGGGIHGVHVTAATLSADAGGDAHLCQSRSGGASGMAVCR